MLPGYGTEGFLNKDVSVVMNERTHPINEKSDQKTPLQALPYGLPIGSPLFTKNGIGLEWSKSRMQQYDDVWDTSKCRGMGGRGSGTDARGLGYPEYIRDLETKEVRSYHTKKRPVSVFKLTVLVFLIYMLHLVLLMVTQSMSIDALEELKSFLQVCFSN